MVNNTKREGTYFRDPAEASKIEGGLRFALGRDYFDGEQFTHQARLKALNWILYEDPLQLNSLQPQNLLQRYLLVHFYLQTTKSMPWAECGMILGGGSSLCYYPENYRASGTWGNNWLSDSHECQWAGVTCTGVDEGRNVTGLILGTLDGCLQLPIIHIAITWCFL